MADALGTETAQVEQVCRHCGVIIHKPKRGPRSQHCSTLCRSRDRHGIPPGPWKCKQCGNLFICERNRKYCSKECRVESLKKVQLVCEWCKREFQARSLLRHCSISCSQLARFSRAKQEREEEKRNPTHQCQWCGLWYLPKASNRVKYCSRECAFAFRKDRSKKRQEYIQHKKIKPWLDWDKATNCKWCGLCFLRTGKSVATCCCYECKYELYRENAKAKHRESIGYRECRMCGWRFLIGDKSGNFLCSQACIDERNRQHRRNAKRRRRARLWNTVVGNYKRKDVFIRDRWICHICGEPVERKEKAPHPKAPTIDHVIPLSKGGHDTWRNVRCACWTCNCVVKRDKIMYAETKS